jgi:hypothetical protein
MAFKTVFIAHAPDADPEIHNNLIETGKYRLYTYVVKTQIEAIRVCKDLYEKEQIESVLLCPGFTHSDVAEIFAALENKVAVCGGEVIDDCGRKIQDRGVFWNISSSPPDSYENKISAGR